VKRTLRLQSRDLLAAFAGVALTAAFPKFNLAGLAWLAPGLILLAGLGTGNGGAFRAGYVAGLAHFLTSLYWLLFIPFPVGAVAGWLALCLYLALYPAAWVWLCWRTSPARNLSASGGWRHAAEQFFRTPWWQRAAWAVLCAALWVALEMVRARLFTGFPWNLLGVSQFEFLPVIQIAAVSGVYGVSFLIAWLSVSLAMGLLRLARHPKPLWRWMAELRLALVGLLLVAIYGVNRLSPTAASDRTLNVALVQPSIRQEMIWDHSADQERFDKIIGWSRLALLSGPDLLIWPESSTPDLSDANFQIITNLIATHKVWMILGANDMELSDRAAGVGEYDAFNAAHLFDPNGRFVASYRKQHLVAFGEYLPLARGLPFLRRIIPVPGDFTPGDRPVTFEMSGPSARFSVLICFEDVVSGLARRAVSEDLDFLLNLTNDGWFGESAAQWQQAANAVFRAVENGLPLVRCTNNGLTCWIDERGRIRQIFADDAGNVYAPGFMTASIPLLAAGQVREPTFYHRYGDWFGWLCIALGGTACVYKSILRKASALRPGSCSAESMRAGFHSHA